jgi:tetratricopeptide (TPR) repeat protein
VNLGVELTTRILCWCEGLNGANDPYDVRNVGEVAGAHALLFQRADVAYKEKARALTDNAVAIDPNNPQASLTRAIVMQVTGDRPEALKPAERALELDPLSSNADVYLVATEVLIGNARMDDAIAMARRAIGVLPNPQNTVFIRVELARALALNGQQTDALAELDATLAIRPTDPAALQLRAQIRGRTTQ